MLTEERVVHDVLPHAQPTDKLVTTEGLGELAVFLCQNGAKSITGAAIPVGGQLSRFKAAARSCAGCTSCFGRPFSAH